MLYYEAMSDPTALARALGAQTQEEERYRMARLLQEGPAQLLANAALEIETVLRLWETQPETARQGLTALLDELRRGLNDLRALIAELQPPLLNELGLRVGLQKYVENFSAQTGITAQWIGWDALTERLPAMMEIAIFRIVQEALENVRAHSGARHVQVRFDRAPEQLTVTISDDGRGFEVTRGAAVGRRLGLVTMRDRAELLGGNLQIFSEPGHGVRVVLTAPLRAAPRSSNRGG